MVTLKLFLCAKSVVVDRFSNSVSIHELVEELSPAKFPAVIPELAALALLEKDDGDPDRTDCALTVTLAGDTIFEQRVVANFEGRKHTRNVMMFRGVPVTKPGLMEFHFRIADRDAGLYRVRVSLATPPHLQTPSALN